MKVKLILVASIFLGLLLACKRQEIKPALPEVTVVPQNVLDIKAGFEQLRWLEGMWQDTANGVVFCESWKFVNDTLIENREIHCDTKISKAELPGAFIKSSINKLEYTNNPSIDKELLVWVITELDSVHIKLENPHASYSQTMIFEHTPTDIWKAILIGKTEKVVYNMKRMQ